jgi:hypothetical protein
MCECNSGLCVKNSLCNYDSKTDPFQSSSGIDINEYENFGNVDDSRYVYRNRNLYRNRHRRDNFVYIIILIFIFIFVFLKKNNINLK